MEQLKVLAGILIWTYFLLGLILYIFQRNFIYFPTAKINHPFEIEEFSINNEIINVVLLNKGKKNAILYFGGNAENVYLNASSFIENFPQHTIYLVNYRGYAGSTGTPSEKILYQDANYIYDKLDKRHKEISIIGRSLGTGIATFLASNRAINKLILISPYDSIANIVQDIYPIYPISLMLKDKYESSTHIKNIKSPTLVILAEHDNVIQSQYSYELIKVFPSAQVKVEIIKGSGHNTLSEKQEYDLLLHQFMNNNE